jgi:formylglycine-generating enzyme required for sulfatase activity
VPAHDLRISQVETVRVALVLVGAESPWQAKQAMIRMFRDTRQVVGVHLPGASKSPETMDGSVESWIDLREGFQAEGLAVLCSKILPAAVQEPVPGEVWVEPTTGIRFVYVPAGNFEMGRDDGTAEEQPQHSVQMSAFWLGETPVTNNQYARFRAEEGHREPALWRSERFSDPSQPVVGIDWNDAQAFCAWLSRAAKVEVKLPSEAQWEYAARGTDRRVYPWGNEPPNPSLACFTDSGVDALPPVGSYPEGRGPFGALDQAGTVWEWCEDVWNKKIYSTRVAGAVLDPVTTTGDPISRVLRGGSWYNGDMALAAATRVTLKANYRDGSVGLRVVVPVRHPRP